MDEDKVSSRSTKLKIRSQNCEDRKLLLLQPAQPAGGFKTRLCHSHKEKLHGSSSL